MKKTCFCILPLLILLLTSCENFMNAGDVQKEIENAVNKANAKSFNLVISQDTSMGSFLSSGEKECKLGYSINVQFNVKKDSYIFKGLKAVSTSNDEVSRNDCINFTTIESDSDRGIYKLSIQLLKEATDILILPDCTQVPGVVKDDCLPVYSDSGCEQDTTIAIAFNKPVSTTENFTLSITDVSGNSLSEYFNKPYFSSDSTILYIPTNKEKLLIETNDSINTRDIFVKIDLSNIEDSEGHTGKNVFQYKYRVNKQRDNTKPVLDVVRLYSTNDTESEYYKEITKKNPATWSDSGTNFGDYGTFHVNKTIYIELEGSDIGAGIGNFLIKEKLLKYTDGTTTDYSEVTYHTSCSTDLETGINYCTYNINTAFDGIIQLTIYAEDYAQNVSTGSETFWVLKDSLIDALNVEFKEEIAIPPVNPDEQAGFYANLIKKIDNVDGDFQTVTLTLDETVKSNGKKGAQDYFYGNLYSPFDIEVYWSNSEKEINNKVEKNSDGKYIFTRDVDKFAYIKVVCRDSVGNEKEITRIMAPRPEIIPGEDRNTIGISRLMEQILQCNIQTAGIQIDPSTYCVCIYEFTPQNQAPITCVREGSACPEEYVKEFLNSKYPDLTAENMPKGQIKIYISTTLGSFYSPKSTDYLGAEITSWTQAQNGIGLVPVYKSAPAIFSSSAVTITKTEYSYGPEDKDYINREPLIITAEPLTNCNSYKVKIDNYSTPEGIDAGVIYSFYIMAFKKKTPNTQSYTYFLPGSYTSNQPELILSSPAGYRFYVLAYDPEAETLYCPIKYDNFLSGVNDGGILPENTQSLPLKTIIKKTRGTSETTESTQTLLLREDLTPPEVQPDNSSSFMLGNSTGFHITVTDHYYDEFAEYETENVQNNPLSEQLPKNKNGNYELTYYIIPNPSNVTNYYPSYSISELENDYSAFKKKLECSFPDVNDTNPDIRVCIPFGDLASGFYTISFIPEDIHGNTAIYTYPFINTKLGKLDYEFNKYPYWDNNGFGYYYNFTVDDATDFQSTEPQLQAKTRLAFEKVTGNDWTEDSQTPVSFQEVTNPETNVSKPGLQFYCLFYEEDPWRRLKAVNGFVSPNDILADGKGFYNYEYLYLGPNPFCNVKNCIEGLNGLQIMSDHPVLVHTMFSTEKLTESKNAKNAISIWETKGAETGVTVFTTNENETILNKTYDLSNLKKIPKGCYYTIIVHFADGTIVMTDIKQKE